MFANISSYSHHVSNYEDEVGSVFSLEWYTDRPKDLILTNVFVKEHYRRQGIGNKILKEAELAAKVGNFNRLFVKVAGGTWMSGWYSRKGFDFYETDKYDGSYIWKVKKL